MNKMKWVCVPDTGNTGTINCPMWTIETNIVPSQRTRDVIAGRQIWGDDDHDEKDAIDVCVGGDRNGWH
jgi:hypothetical protein